VTPGTGQAEPEPPPEPEPAPEPEPPPEIPPVAHEVVAIVRDVLGEALIGAYLHGSAVLGGLHPTSDIDVLAVIGRSTTEPERRALVHRLLEISGRRARRGPGRPIELTILVQSDVRPWRQPPRVEFLYGEWRRNDYEAGFVPAPEPMADLGPEIALTLADNRALAGPPPAEVLDPIPDADLRRAITAGVPSLMADLDSDTRNVLLTLARIWATLATGQISSKDDAAAWALGRLPDDLAGPLNLARAMYLEGWDRDDWADELARARATANHLVAEIRRANDDEQEVGGSAQ
jgi:streptomycin 3"-adenylyltransferase